MRTIHRLNKEYTPKCMCNAFGADDAAFILAGLGTTAQVGGGILTARKNREFAAEQAEKQKAWSEEMWNKSNAYNYEMWLKENEYNTPEAQKQRLLDAGLNPMFYGLDGTGNAGDLTAAQPLGYERAGAENQLNPLAGLGDLGNTIANIKNQNKLINAQVDKLQEETSSIKLDNQFKDDTMAAREEGIKLANELSKEQIHKIDQEIKESEKRIDKMIEETKNEIEKRGLILAQTTLTKAQEKEIVELLPQKKLLMKAQTEAQKAAASASYMHTMYEKGLIDNGYLDKLCEDLDASIAEKHSRAEATAAQQAINEWKLSIKNGNVFDIDNIPNWRYTDKIAGTIVNDVFKFVSAASEAIGGSLAGIL